MATFPTVIDRNVETPSRVQLNKINFNTYDVTPITGKVFEQGTLINADLFNGVKSYIDGQDEIINAKTDEIQNQLTPVKIKVDDVADYIFDKGVSQNWNYIKYKNGLAVVFTRKQITTPCEKPWGSVFESPLLSVDDFPFVFKNISWINISTTGLTGNTISVEVQSPRTLSLSAPPSFYLVRASKKTITVEVFIATIGWWQ